MIHNFPPKNIAYEHAKGRFRSGHFVVDFITKKPWSLDLTLAHSGWKKKEDRNQPPSLSNKPEPPNRIALRAQECPVGTYQPHSPARHGEAGTQGHSRFGAARRSDNSEEDGRHRLSLPRDSRAFARLKGDSRPHACSDSLPFRRANDWGGDDAAAQQHQLG